MRQLPSPDFAIEAESLRPKSRGHHSVIRALKLPNFPSVTIGAAWTGKLSPIAQQFLQEVEQEATSLRKSPTPR